MCRPFAGRMPPSFSRANLGRGLASIGLATHSISMCNTPIYAEKRWLARCHQQAPAISYWRSCELTHVIRSLFDLHCVTKESNTCAPSDVSAEILMAIALLFPHRSGAPLQAGPDSFFRVHFCVHCITAILGKNSRHRNCRYDI